MGGRRGGNNLRLIAFWDIYISLYFVVGWVDFPLCMRSGSVLLSKNNLYNYRSSELFQSNFWNFLNVKQVYVIFSLIGKTRRCINGIQNTPLGINVN